MDDPGTPEAQRVLVADMTRRAAAVVQQAPAAGLPMDDIEDGQPREGGRRGWSYLPGPRSGAALADMDRTAAKAAMHLLAAGLTPHAYAQAAAVMALEDVLDERESGRRGRHRGDYYLAVFGTPGQAPWGWRLEGHHLSVNWTLDHDRVLGATPQFTGANPARVQHGDGIVLGPLALEERLAVALVEALDADQRSQAVLPGDVPGDILSRFAPSVDEDLAPAGVAVSDLGGRTAGLAGQLVELYTGRLPAGLPVDAGGAARFAWCGGTAVGEPRYYRLQGPELLIELDNTQDSANHVHSVVRRPGADFGEDALRVHRATSH